MISKFRSEMLLSLVLLAATFSVFGKFLLWIEKRPGVILPDPILPLLPSINLSIFLSVIMYGALLHAILYFRKIPRGALRFAESYMVLLWLRMAAMFCCPLDPPPGMIPLVDPFVQIFMPTEPLQKDLFFSGHTATVFLIFLLVEDRWLKSLYFVATLAIAGGVLLQHVHYSVDVIAAPTFAYAAVQITLAWERYRRAFAPVAGESQNAPSIPIA